MTGRPRSATTSGGAVALLRPDSLAVAGTLSVVAGMVDAITYLDHNHAFATFVTGNMILLALHLVERQDALPFALPIGAYALGAIAATLIGRSPAMKTPPRAHLIAIAVAATILIVIAFVRPGFGDHVFVALLTAGTAMLNTTFRSANGQNYNSAYMTGNLQSLSTSLATSVATRDGQKAVAALDLCIVILAFFAGALAGGLLVPRLHQRCLFLPAAALVVVAIGLTAPGRRRRTD